MLVIPYPYLYLLLVIRENPNPNQYPVNSGITRQSWDGFKRVPMGTSFITMSKEHLKSSSRVIRKNGVGSSGFKKRHQKRIPYGRPQDRQRFRPFQRQSAPVTKGNQVVFQVGGRMLTAIDVCRNLPFGGRATRDSRDACSTKGIRAESPPTFI